MKDTWKLEHVGFIVRDLDKAIQTYQALGATTILPLMDVTSSPDNDPTVRMRLRLCCLKIGGMGLELLQPVEGNSLQMEFLQKHGEGINHISYAVDDLDKEMAEMTEKGFPAIHTRKINGELIEAYFDTRKTGNVITALCLGKPKLDAESWTSFLSMLGKGKAVSLDNKNKADNCGAKENKKGCKKPAKK